MSKLEGIFHALADASRLGMVDRLSRGPASVSELAEPLDMALPSVMKHLAVLADAGVVRSKKTGRVRTYELEPRTLGAIERWVSTRKSAMNARFDRLERLLAEEDD